MRVPEIDFSKALCFQLLFFACWFLPQRVAAQKARITEEERVFVTYPYGDPNPVPVLTSAKKYKIYPYHSFDGYTTKSTKQKWKVVKLENAFIEVYVLPEVGGKVWGAIEKSTGKEFIYRNEVMKFRDISWRGPWTSGGIEFNFGVIGHTPSTSSPVDYLVRENKDGSVSCFVGNMDLPSRTQWRVEISLPADKAYFETHATWYNSTPLTQSYYNWMTGAAKVSDDLQFFYPGTTELEHNGKASRWPVNAAGKDVSLYANNNFGPSKSYHVTGEYNDFMGGYYHNSRFGFGHWALYDEMPGHKLWLWALSREGGIWEDLLTDSNGQYMEFQAGRNFNQYSPSSFRSPISQMGFQPGITDKWSEIWFPVKEIGGLTDVSPQGVLHVNRTNNMLEIGVNALAFARGTVVVKSNGKTIFSQSRTFKPMDVFTSKVPLPETAPYEVAVEGLDLKYNPEKRDILKRPFASDTTVQYQNSANELYEQGVEAKEFRDYSGAKEKFRSSLQQDPLHTGSMVALSELHYRSAQYDSALALANKVLRMDTYHPAANFQAGNAYRAKGDDINAMECFGWAARSLEFRTAAYAQMSELQLQRGNLLLAEHYAKQSLDYNRHHVNAMQALVVVYRKSKQPAKAKNMLAELTKTDPLNHFAGYENYLLAPTARRYADFTSAIRSEFPYQIYLELALTYVDLADTSAALNVLDKAPVHPIVSIWKAYLKKDASYIQKAITVSPAFVFPYRRETLAALAWAASASNHWKLMYYQALNLWAVDRRVEATALLKALGQQPDFAPFYLTRASLLKQNKAQALADLQKAHQLDANDWRTWSSLIDQHEKAKNNKEALSLAAQAHARFKDNYTLALQYASQLLNGGQYEESMKLLNTTTILPFEGAGEGRVVYEQALLLHAIQLIKSSDYAKALTILEKSREWPESLGVGKPYDPDTRIQDYLTAYCLEKLNRSENAQEWQNKVVSASFAQSGPRDLYSVLAMKILQAKGETAKAQLLLQKASNSSASDINRWMRAAFERDVDTMNALERNLSDDKYFRIIMEINRL
jgi:outer membrane protein assembly factor BamD (BamD/ComL family)